MRVLALFFLIFLSACATSPPGGQDGTVQTEISREQIAATGASTLYDAVRVLHREWLPRRQGSFIVVADHKHLIWGRINANDTRETLNRNPDLSVFLRNGGTEGVFLMELLRENEASGLWAEYIGDRDFAGAIIVWTQPRGED